MTPNKKVIRSEPNSRGVGARGNCAIITPEAVGVAPGVALAVAVAVGAGVGVVVGAGLALAPRLEKSSGLLLCP